MQKVSNKKRATLILDWTLILLVVVAAVLGVLLIVSLSLLQPVNRPIQMPAMNVTSPTPTVSQDYGSDGYGMLSTPTDEPLRRATATP